MRNSWSAKILRTLSSILPVSHARHGKCSQCGKCCSLPNRCPFLRLKDGKGHCSIHFWRPLNCRKYPRTQHEHITKKHCSYGFAPKNIK